MSAIAVLVASSPGLSWWAIPDLSYDGPSSIGYDYAFGPYDAGAEGLRAAGWLCAAAAAVAVLVLLGSAAAGWLPWRWWLVAAAGSAAGFAGALSWRTATRRFVGADVGGGPALLLGCAAVGVMLYVAVRAAVILRRRPECPTALLARFWETPATFDLERDARGRADPPFPG